MFTTTLKALTVLLAVQSSKSSSQLENDKPCEDRVKSNPDVNINPPCDVPKKLATLFTTQGFFSQSEANQLKDGYAKSAIEVYEKASEFEKIIMAAYICSNDTAKPGYIIFDPKAWIGNPCSGKFLSAGSTDLFPLSFDGLFQRVLTQLKRLVGYEDPYLMKVALIRSSRKQLWGGLVKHETIHAGISKCWQFQGMGFISYAPPVDPYDQSDPSKSTEFGIAIKKDLIFVRMMVDIADAFPAKDLSDKHIRFAIENVLKKLKANKKYSPEEKKMITEFLKAENAPIVIEQQLNALKMLKRKYAFMSPKSFPPERLQLGEAFDMRSQEGNALGKTTITDISEDAVLVEDKTEGSFSHQARWLLSMYTDIVDRTWFNQREHAEYIAYTFQQFPAEILENILFNSWKFYQNNLIPACRKYLFELQENLVDKQIYQDVCESEVPKKTR